jgi:hypothetical protein
MPIRSLVHAAVTLAVATLAPSAAWAVSPSAPMSVAALSTQQAEQELAAVRKALIEQALEGPTRVRAWAWVDEQGALRERNEVSADMRVRGVRVTAYTDQGREPVATIAAATAQSETGSCHFTNGRWRLPVSVQADWHQVRLADHRLVAAASAKQLVSAWSEQLRGGQRFEATPRQASPEFSRYERALLGALDSEAGWRALWSVNVVSVPQERLGLPMATSGNVLPQPDTALVQLRLSVVRERVDGEHASRQTVWERHQVMPVTMVSTGWSVPHLSAQSAAQLDSLAQSWAMALEQQSECEPLQYDVTDMAGKRLRINGGTAAGLQVGDRLVVLDAVNVPSQVWDVGSLEKVAIARVARIDAYGAQLEAVAGRVPRADGRVVALPY